MTTATLSEQHRAMLSAFKQKLAASDNPFEIDAMRHDTMVSLMEQGRDSLADNLKSQMMLAAASRSMELSGQNPHQDSNDPNVVARRRVQADIERAEGDGNHELAEQMRDTLATLESTPVRATEQSAEMQKAIQQGEEILEGLRAKDGEIVEQRKKFDDEAAAVERYEQLRANGFDPKAVKEETDRIESGSARDDG